MAIGDVSATSGSVLDPIAGAIKNAAAATGVDFSFLFQQAKVESGLNAQAKAGTSSATGLFQFTRDTWLKVVEQHGDEIGLSGEAASLRNGVASATDRQKILELRNNPEISARLAAQYAVDNARALQAQGHTVSGPTDLYLAHFLGSNGAAKFLSAMKDNPNAPAATILPGAANANRSIFYKDGAPVSVRDIYQRFASRFDNAVPASKRSVQLASATLAETSNLQKGATVDSFTQRLKTPETFTALKPKGLINPDAIGKVQSQLDGSIASQAGLAPFGSVVATHRPNTSTNTGAKAPVTPMPLQPVASSTPSEPTPVSVDSLAKFLDSASKWSPDPGKMDTQAQKGVAFRDAYEGIHSHSDS
jgi:hypothetical protein